VYFEDIYKTLHTGDVVLIRMGGCSSGCIAFSTCSHFSHAGVIVREEDNDEKLSVKQIKLSHSVVPKVKTDSLRSMCMTGAYADMCIRRLKTRLSPENEAKVVEYVNSTTGAAYDSNCCEQFKAACDIPCWCCCSSRECFLCRNKFNPEQDKKLFCSEHLARALIAGGALSADANPPNEYVPGDFEEGGKEKAVQDILSPAVYLVMGDYKLIEE